MTYPLRVQEFIKQFNEKEPNSENRAFFESEDGDFFGFGYASPFEFITAVNKYLIEVSDRSLPEDMFLPEDAKKRWGISVDTPRHDEVYVTMDKVTERTPFAFQLYHIVT